MSPDATLIARAAILNVQAQGMADDIAELVDLDPGDGLGLGHLGPLAELLAELAELIHDVAAELAVATPARRTG